MKTTEEDLLRSVWHNGRSPTTRERWVAFHRLWRCLDRAAQKREVAGSCLRTLMRDWGWVQLLQSTGDELELLRFMPVPCRWQVALAALARRTEEANKEREDRAFLRALNDAFEEEDDCGDEMT